MAPPRRSPPPSLIASNQLFFRTGIYRTRPACAAATGEPERGEGAVAWRKAATDPERSAHAATPECRHVGWWLSPCVKTERFETAARADAKRRTGAS